MSQFIRLYEPFLVFFDTIKENRFAAVIFFLSTIEVLTYTYYNN